MVQLVLKIVYQCLRTDKPYSKADCSYDLPQSYL